MPHVLEGTASSRPYRLALVVSKYHDVVTHRLEAGALAALTSAGVAADGLTIVRVPGAFEIPVAARLAADSGQFDAIVCLGCLVRGATPHFDVIASAVAHGLTDTAGTTGVPIGFGVLTTNSLEEALERSGDGPSNKGWEAAAAALEMADLAARFVQLGLEPPHRSRQS